MNGLYILAIIGVWLIGYAMGFFSRNYLMEILSKAEDKSIEKFKTLFLTTEAVRYYLVFIVTTIWVITVLASMIDRTFEVPLPIHACFGSIVGFFFVSPKKIIKKVRNED